MLVRLGKAPGEGEQPTEDGFAMRLQSQRAGDLEFCYIRII